MGKACKKDWDTDIAYIRNSFAFIAVWINSLRMEAKIGVCPSKSISVDILYVGYDDSACIAGLHQNRSNP